jgi:hypothetical protein
MQAGQGMDRNGRAGLGWGAGVTEKMCTLHAVIMLCFCFGMNIW